MQRLAIITTHPIQYYAPLFRLLAQRGRVQVKVFYTWGEQAKDKVFDPGFGKQRQWDIPLLDGYDYDFVTNTSSAPGSSHYKGIINPDLVKRIDDFGPNALLVFGWAFHSHLKVMRHFKGKIPVLFRGDSTLLDEPKGFSIKKVARRIFLTWVYKHIDKALYVGTNNKAYYKAHGVGDSKLVFSPHAIDNDRFAANDEAYKQQANKWKQELKISEDKVCVLFAGKLEGKKNPQFMVQAAKSLPQMHFIIAGNGVMENEIKQAAEMLQNVTLLPFQNQSQMPVLYRMATVFALPSLGPGETWGLAMNEAMASGCIIIGSNKCGGSIDLIKEEKNGYMIEPKIDLFIAALKKVEDNGQMIDDGGKVSKQVISDFSFSRVCEAVERHL